MSVMGFKKKFGWFVSFVQFILDVWIFFNFAKTLSMYILLDYSIMYSLGMLHYTMFVVVFDYCLDIIRR